MQKRTQREQASLTYNWNSRSESAHALGDRNLSHAELLQLNYTEIFSAPVLRDSLDRSRQPSRE